jgi:pilus assembly protein CpaB
MTKAYLDQQRKVVVEDAKKKLIKAQEVMRTNQSAVLVSKQDIPKGATIESEMLEVVIVPNEYVQPQAINSLDRISGMITIAPISKGEQITLTKLAYPRQAEASGLAGLTPVGKRAITIPIADNTSSLLGMVKPGDYVDVMVLANVPIETMDGKQVTKTAAIPLFQNVLVLAMGQNIGQPVAPTPESRYKPAEAAPSPSTVTLALSPQEANLMAFIQEQGRIRLILRSPADSKIEPMHPASWDSIFQYLMPPQESAMPKPKEESAPATATSSKSGGPGYVEIYRGLSKEKVPLSP